MGLAREEFERMTQEVFDSLPAQFQQNMENVSVIVEDEPTEEILARMGIRSTQTLFGLYEGIPLNRRGTWYGMNAVVPDKISLYKQNIERGAGNEPELRARIRHVLIHEIAHYYGMNEDEVRAAGY
jgi:predicted Zn-dependent protease with MMP-like domain